MDNSELRSILDKVASDIKLAVRVMMESERGINDKVNKNTLVDSHIFNELEVNEADLGLYHLLVNDYVQYIESGMKEGHWVSEKYLLPWMADKGIPTDNETLRKIQGSIYWYGISPRPFMEDAFAMMDEYWDGWSDNIFNALCKPLDEFFNG